ncbi:hypothetical protein [Streptomyces sp. NRRL S-920]|uniref:hypothetical protein n=1 Tax=Streptomyces sp. NRRL S-920 TaxID=1463921 RepID=UPI0004C78FC1|nr:hypothetical protein [Streptomyces sp. NRRL S-920]
MSARQDIAAMFESRLSEAGRRRLQELLDTYAHELAEKIRNSRRLRDYTDDHMGDCLAAADLIDPEVSDD